MSRLPRTRSRAAVLVLAAVALTLTGCAASPGDAPSTCVPRFDVTPRTAHAGDTVTFSTTDECGVDVPDGGWRIVLRRAGSNGAASDAVRSTERFDGSWSVSVPVPSDTEPGDASVSIANWDYAPCPADASCPGPSRSFTVAR